MRIAFLCNEYPPEPHGGIGTFVKTLAPALAGAGHHVLVVGFSRSPGERWDGPVRIVRLPECRVRGIAWLVNRWRLRQWLRREALAGRLDLVEVPDFEGLLPFAFPWCPVVVRLHLAQTTIARDSGVPVAMTTRLCERETLAHHRRWIAVSAHALRLTEETFALHPVDRIISYYPVAELPPGPEGGPALPAGPFVLYCGTVSERKGALVLAQAARQFLRETPELHLVYAGAVTSENGRSIEFRVREILGSELSSRAHFLGRLDRTAVRGAMARARVFAFPSRLETFGLVIAEAMLAATPIVTNRLPPFDEFVEDGNTGILVQPGDPEALAAAIGRLIQDEPRARKIALRGRAHIQTYMSLGRSLDASLSFYRRLIEPERQTG